MTRPRLGPRRCAPWPWGSAYTDQSVRSHWHRCAALLSPSPAASRPGLTTAVDCCARLPAPGRPPPSRPPPASLVRAAFPRLWCSCLRRRGQSPPPASASRRPNAVSALPSSGGLQSAHRSRLPKAERCYAATLQRWNLLATTSPTRCPNCSLPAASTRVPPIPRPSADTYATTPTHGRSPLALASPSGPTPALHRPGCRFVSLATPTHSVPPTNWPLPRPPSDSLCSVLVVIHLRPFTHLRTHAPTTYPLCSCTLKGTALSPSPRAAPPLTHARDCSVLVSVALCLLGELPPAPSNCNTKRRRTSSTLDHGSNRDHEPCGPHKRRVRQLR